MQQPVDLELCELIKETTGVLTFDQKNFNCYQGFPKAAYLRPYLTSQIAKLDLKFDIEKLRRITYEVMTSYGLQSKDGAKNYGGIALQFSESDDDVLFGAIPDFRLSKSKGNHNYSKLNEVGEHYKFVYDEFKDFGLSLVRGRILGAKPKMKIPAHKDYDYRIHIPIWTNDKAFALFGDNKYHMPADGSSYLHNGYHSHSACNDGETDRVHLVFIIKPSSA